MNVKKVLNYCYFLFLCVFSFDVVAEIDVKKELDSGKAVVLIINVSEKNDSEQYADWAHYLNQFSKDVEGKYVFHKVSTEQLKKIIVNGEKYQKKYSMIFIKKGKPDYFYEGAIVEPQVYQYVNFVFEGKTIAPKSLEQFAPEKVTIKFKNCN